MHVDVVGMFLGDRRLPADFAAVRPVVVTHEQAGLPGQRKDAGTERNSMPAPPPGKSARAVPPSGMNSVSPMKAASPMTWVMQAGVWPGVYIAKAIIPPMA